jgi:hypothetical protein
MNQKESSNTPGVIAASVKKKSQLYSRNEGRSDKGE